MYGGVCGEIAINRFNFSAYWRECEANKGRKMTEDEVWAELVKDIQGSLEKR